MRRIFWVETVYICSPRRPWLESGRVCVLLVRHVPHVRCVLESRLPTSQKVSMTQHPHLDVCCYAGQAPCCTRHRSQCLAMTQLCSIAGNSCLFLRGRFLASC